jgi:hypothetical protein
MLVRHSILAPFGGVQEQKKRKTKGRDFLISCPLDGLNHTLRSALPEATCQNKDTTFLIWVRVNFKLLIKHTVVIHLCSTNDCSPCIMIFGVWTRLLCRRLQVRWLAPLQNVSKVLFWRNPGQTNLNREFSVNGECSRAFITDMYESFGSMYFQTAPLRSHRRGVPTASELCPSIIGWALGWASKGSY